MSAAATPLLPLLDRQRALQLIARSLFRELKSHGYTPQHVISITSELLQLLIEEMRGSSSEARLEFVAD